MTSVACAQSSDISSGQKNPQNRLRRTFQRHFHGWRGGVFTSCCLSAIVLLCNIGLIIKGAKNGYDKYGIADVIEGDETTVAQWNIALHVLINVLGTILLSGSNYTLQVLSSPTRDELDKFHKRGEWLDIGVLSLRNIRALPRWRASLCVLLSLSSIPLHLLYVESS